MITVYSQPNCAACRYTKKFLTKWGIPFTEIDVSVNGDARKALVEQGFKGMEMPVVKTDHGSWSGYRREKLLDLKAVYERGHHA